MNKEYKIISIGRSLVDVVFTLNDKKYEMIQKYLNLEPGDWTEIFSVDQLKYIFDFIAGIKYPITPDSINDNAMVTFIAGSTNLNVFSALSGDLRQKSAIVTAIGVDENGKHDILSTLYTKGLRQKMIEHISYPFIGNNPLSLVFVSLHNPEKIMASYLGISSNLNKLEDVNSEYIYIDAYELLGGPISLLIKTLILSQKYKIILGLGNATILNGDLLELIKSYIQGGMINTLCGNIYEYQKISFFLEVDKILQDQIFSKVQNILLTQGAKGMVGFFDGEIVFQKAVNLPQIVNTTGAGDTAAGAFISGIISKNNPKSIMENAAAKAYKYLKLKC